MHLFAFMTFLLTWLIRLIRSHPPFSRPLFLSVRATSCARGVAYGSFRGMRHWLIALVLLTGCLPAFAQQTTPKITPDDDRYAALAMRLEKAGSNFDQVFAELCRTALADVDKNPKHRLDDQVRAMFGGMWLWILHGGKPVLQGMNDKVFHFIGGGMFQGYFELGLKIFKLN